MRKVAFLAGAAVLVAACGLGSGGGSATPTTTTSASGTASATSSGSPSASASSSTAATYPSGARAYAEAIMSAYKLHQLTRLGNLTTPLVQEQMIEIPGPPNMSWTYHRCDGTAGSSYCDFFNADGDQMVLRISHSLLGHPHAGIEVRFDETIYPTDPADYVDEFIKAWGMGNRIRMKLLANQTELDYFTHYVPPTDYSLCTDGAAGSTYVRVYNSDGLNYVIRVTNATLGHPHAIAAHVTPPVPPACP